MNSRLAKLLYENGYTLYTPFRTKDYPASIFVLSRNHEGRWTEFPVAKYTETFDVDPNSLFDPDGQQVDFMDKLADGFDFSGTAGAELASVVVKPELAAKYSRRITMSFGDPKITHEISFLKLNQLKSQLSDETRAVLTDLKERDQLKYVYLVLQTLRVESINVDLHLKREFAGKLDAAQLEQVAKLGAEITTITNGRVSVSSKQPMIIGYKALAFPETMLRTEVSPFDLPDLKLVAPQYLVRMKKSH